MRSDLTDITVLLDRSHSMTKIQAVAESGLNEFVDAQKAGPGEALFSYIQFDHDYTPVLTAVPIKEVPRLALTPRGNTALYDALGRAIKETGERLAKMDEAARPGLVMFVILTDGEENASREFDQDSVRKLVQEQEQKYSWQFTYLGANQDAFAVGRGMGLAAGAVMNYAQEKTAGAFAMAGAAAVRGRSARLTDEDVAEAMTYTDDERESVK